MYRYFLDNKNLKIKGTKTHRNQIQKEEVAFKTQSKSNSLLTFLSCNNKMRTFSYKQTPFQTQEKRKTQRKGTKEEICCMSLHIIFEQHLEFTKHVDITKIDIKERHGKKD